MDRDEAGREWGKKFKCFKKVGLFVRACERVCADVCARLGRRGGKMERLGKNFLGLRMWAEAEKA